MSNELMVLSFQEAKQPEYKEKKGEGGGYIEFGYRNDYPNYLVELYNKSAKHNAIVKGKVNYITGNGFKAENPDPIAEQFIKQPNQYESIDEITRKVSTDIELFGGAYVEVIWSLSGDNIAEIYHVDYTKIRTNEDNTQFWYSDNWLDRKYKREVYNAFNTQLRTGKQILYLKEYRPDLKAYALPGYFGALNYIESDIEVSKHILGNAQTGFSASKLITLPNGEPTDEEKRQVERKFTDRFTGSDGKKFILSFTNDASRKPIIEDLGASDITKEDFSNVDKIIQQNLYAGHQITAPDLFGISTPGQLGSRQQMRDSYEIFKNTYVNDKQIFIEQIFNVLAKLRGATSEIKIAPVEPIGIEFSEQAILQVAPKEWILEKLGIDMTQYQNQPEPSTEVAPTTMRSEFSEDEVISLFAQFGESADEYVSLQKRQVFGMNPSDEEEAMNLEFAVNELTVMDASILDLIQKDKRITPEVIASTLKTDISVINRRLNSLESNGYIKSTDVKGTTNRVLPKPLSELNAPKAETKSVMIKYSYEWKPSVPSNQRDTSAHPSRYFCHRMMQLNRVYSRAEIETISARLGYSVFDRRGGWWTQPNGDHSPSCRHIWMSNVIIKKD
jgi:DNA-binding Lrp family transcriptional regulator